MEGKKMALHLNEDKDQNVVFGSSFLSNPVFERRRGEKGEKRLGIGKDQILGGVFFPLLAPL